MAPDGDIRLSQSSFPKVSAVSEGDLKGQHSHIGTSCSLEPGFIYFLLVLYNKRQATGNNA